MKLKNIIPSCLAVFGLMLAGCSDEETPTYLTNLQVSSSYVAIGVKGGEQTITVKATEAWTLDVELPVSVESLDDQKGVVKTSVPTKQLDTKDRNWIKVSQNSGEAGTTQLTFSADSASGSRSATILIKCGDLYQNLVVSQSSDAALPETPLVKVLGGTNGVTYRVTGTCSRISNTSYGNWYMTDDKGNSLYIYGTIDGTGSYNWKSFNIEVGDMVTIEGPRSVYNSVIQLEKASVVTVKKALLQTKETTKALGKEAQQFTLTVTQKGKGLSFVSKADWLDIAPGYKVDKKGDYVFTVTAKENTTGKYRDGEVVLTSTTEKDTTILPIVIQQVATVPVQNGGLADIAKAVAASSSKDNPAYFDVVLKDAKVTYKNGSNIFIEDATGGLLIYNNDLKLDLGQVVNGRVWGSGYSYNGLPEATRFELNLAQVSTGKFAEPTPVTMAQLVADYDKYISRYVVIKGANVSDAIDVKFSAIASAGKLSDGTNTLPLKHQRSGKFNGKEIFYFVQAEKGSTADVICIPSVYKSNKQLNVWTAGWIQKK